VSRLGRAANEPRPVPGTRHVRNLSYLELLGIVPSVPVDALKGHLDLVLLAALAEGPAYGYALIDEIRGRSEGAFDLAEGTVYPALYRLESGGLLASEWTVAAGRRRRMYRLTKRGRTELAKERGQWKQFSDTMKTVVA